MGLLSRFQKHTAPVPVEAAELWQGTHFQHAAASEEMQAVQVIGRTPQIVPAFAVEFALECEEFRPLAEHVAAYAEKHHWDSLQISSLQRLLPGLAEAGLFVTARQVSERLRADAQEESAPPPISTLGIPTGGPRSALVERALRSFAENFRTHGRTVQLLVADSSREREHTATLRTRLQALQPALGQEIVVAGAEEKRAFAAHLARRGACGPEVAEFAWQDPLETGFACGGNRNVLLLHAAGHLVAGVDDDVVCQLARVPGSSAEGLGFFSDHDPYERRIFSGPEEALAAAAWEEADYLALHEALLGRTPGALFQEDCDFSRAGERLSHRALSASCRVRATYTGHVGDPGIPTSLYHLYLDGDNRDRFCASERQYRAALASRSVFCGVPRPSVGDDTLSPGMAYALDGRELLPPFFPVLHAEDFSHSTVLWQSCPGALLGHTPWAVWHDPGAGKGIVQPREFRAGHRAPFFEFAHLLRRLIRSEEWPALATPAARVRSLGRRLAEVGELTPREFQEYTTQLALREACGRIQYLQEQLEDFTDAPAPWRADVEYVIEQLTGAVADETMDIPLDLQKGRTSAEARALGQRLLGNYGALLEAWPAMVEATLALREEGITLAQPVRA